MRLTIVLLKDSSKYVKRYLERTMQDSLGKKKWKPHTGWVPVHGEYKSSKWFYAGQPVWSEQANVSYARKVKTPPLQPIKQQNIYEDDLVEVLVGIDKGKQGHVLRLAKERNWCFVQGLHLAYRLIPGKTPTDPGKLTVREKPLLVTTEVGLVDPSDSKPTEFEWRFTEDGEKVRVSNRTGRIIPIPTIVEDDIALDVGARKSVYKMGNRDTAKDDVHEVTFEPKLATFEEDILESMGIKEEENKDAPKTYWY
ncbi:39S ribosomal protein L24, mitochondrial-like [Mizuhopecten yessoensis]|uniref:39S ribosomal protein L24, mitochondrial n=1 Tax=Mizuhopecten yessoensis TaxID=6573 RepID=A0A210Q339_MIZYE|nr:39S ribosomal protein L24, mitochondrial-like [Mizuhopecten yessoensis]XP_021368461.1 39S ribosomal protein L24, mitochondrial-like [Mizuhopecten yessoensis]OWF43161.1 39S ribosomal protein L24, mitochondrial [Mizuhopecten yessoensis]